MPSGPLDSPACTVRFSPALVNEVRAGYNKISISFNPTTQVDTNALGINLGQTVPVALPQITISGPGLNI